MVLQNIISQQQFQFFHLFLFFQPQHLATYSFNYEQNFQENKSIVTYISRKCIIEIKSTSNITFLIYKVMKNQQSQNYEEQLQQKNEQIKRQQQDQEKQQQQQGQQQEQQQQNGKWRKIQKPQKCINLYMIDFNQCDSKKCTGRKMQRFKLLKTLKDKKKKFKGIVLSAFGQQTISIQDLQICQKSGICVIDCSWHRLQQTNQFRFKNERILPYVVAGNPVNYGKPYQLSCVQALATALCSINYVPQAQYIMSKFGWADGFWSINQRIKQYGQCKNKQQLQQRSKQIQQSQNTMKQNYQSSSSSDSQESDNQNNS